MKKYDTANIEELKKTINLIIIVCGCSYSTLMEMDAFPEQTEILSSFDPEIPMSWAIYPTLGSNGGGYVKIDMIQGMGKRCPLISIRLEEENPDVLFILARDIFGHLVEFDPFQFLLERSHRINSVG